ncbi:MAG TPA: integrin alpha, partial [Flavobacteriales bacterium]
GDGYSDVLLGAYLLGDHGRAYAFHGSATGLPATPQWTADGATQSFYGSSVSLAGDVDGDGYDDVIIGAPLHDDGADANQGAAFVYHGSSAGLSNVPGWTRIGEQHGEQFGISVSYAGDVNGDGYSDVIIGAYLYDNAQQDVGRAHVFHGSPAGGLPASANTIIEGLLPGSRMGMSVCAAGDVNGDGYGDVVVGTPRMSMFYVEQGMASIHQGSAAGVSAVATTNVHGAMAGAHFGTAVALAGDVNGDGYGDIVAGATGHTVGFTDEGGAFVLTGNLSRSLAQPTYQYRNDLVGVVRTGNHTFDPGCGWGIGQFARSALGRSRARLAWQFVGHGPTVVTSHFANNSTDLTGEAGTWTDIGLSGALLKQQLFIGAGSSSHPVWRARLRHHPATALDGRMFGRWFEQGVNDLQVPSLKVEFAGCGPLPVTLAGSSVQCDGERAIIEWTTASEQDCAEFVVQRSLDGSEWETVDGSACAGNSSTLRRYRVLDGSPDVTNLMYYRILQFDIDGSVAVHPVMALPPCGTAASVVRAWPNPFQDVLFIDHVRSPSSWGYLTVELQDMSGRSVRSITVKVTERLVRLEGLSTLPGGAYQLTLRSPEGGVLGHARIVRM